MDQIVWQEPGSPRRRRPIVDQLEAARSREGVWALIATYESRGSATAIMSRLRRRMGAHPALHLATRLLEDGRIGLFARWNGTEAQGDS